MAEERRGIPAVGWMLATVVIAALAAMAAVNLVRPKSDCQRAAELQCADRDPGRYENCVGWMLMACARQAADPYRRR